MIRPLSTIAAISALLAGPAWAAPEALERVYACASIADAASRAACYDEAVAGLKTATQTGQVTVVDNADLQTLQKEVFGFAAPTLPAMLAKTGGAPPVDTIDTTIATLTRGEATTFTLANGQIWRRIDTTDNRSLRAGAAVRIERRVLGSFLLIPKDGSSAVRVRRVE